MGNLQHMARALGGEVSGHQILAPGPGHGPKDRSLSVRLDDKAPDGFVVDSFAGDDWQACKDHVRDRAGLPAFEPQQPAIMRGTLGRPVASYDYHDEEGRPVLRVQRFHPKDFRQSKPDGRGGWKPGGPPSGSLVPYRLSDVLEAVAAGRTVYVTEGEKSADALAKSGLAATCSPMGAGKWRDQYARWFDGAHVVILPDNDKPGADHAAKVAASLGPVAASVRTVNLPGLPPKGDPFDYLEAGGDPLTIADLPDAAPALSGLLAKRFLASSLTGEPPARSWFCPGLIPGGNVTLLSGDGGGGKSTLMLQASVAAALGEPWLGRSLKRGPVLYVSAEDDRAELHRRLDAIGLFYGRQVSQIPDLHLIDLSSDDALLAVSDGRRGDLVTTPLFDELQALVLDLRPALVVLDSLADVFGGDEIRRDHARRFVAILRHLATEAGAAIVVLSHPSLSGLSSGSGTSGSTHWSNSVRSRLYLTRPPQEAGIGGQDDRRLLQVKKANYAASGADFSLRLQAGAFCLDDPGGIDALDRTDAEARVDALFLSMLDSFTAEGRNVSDGGPNFAPKVFADDGRSLGVRKPAFAAAMSRLFAAGAIHQEEYHRGRKRLARRPVGGVA